jgi:hypothetical protein
VYKSRAPVIFRIYGIIFLKKKAWNRIMDRWTESTRPAHGSMRLSLNWSHSLGDQRQGLDQSNRYSFIKSRTLIVDWTAAVASYLLDSTSENTGEVAS